MVDLHVHTKYSLLDSTIEPEELVKKMKAQGKTTLCVTEHGNLYSSIELYKLCLKNGIKYLHACEMYICDDVQINDKDNKYNHLILISKNEAGRRNLVKLVSQSNNHKYFGKPRIDFNMLSAHKEGLIVLSACMAGEIQRALMNNDITLAKNTALKYKDLFGDDYYLEYQSHSDKVQQRLNRQIIDLANEVKIKYVVTTDAHYIERDVQKYHNIFVQIGQSREVGETYNDCFLQTEEEILEICKSTTRDENMAAIRTTEEIANKCNVTIPLSDPIMQHFETPSGFKSEIDYLKHLCIKGWSNRKIDKLSNEQKVLRKKRLAYEVHAIEEMGFEGYYLNVWDYANSVTRRGIARGSGGGSLVAYLLNIVDTDPVKYGLYFERFIDVGALQLLKDGKITKAQLKTPDFDLDFGREDREKVLQSVIDKHGIEKIASLGSFQYIWAKGAIKDIGKVLGIPFSVTNEMTSKLDGETIQEVLDLGLLKQFEKEYPELFEYASKLAGLPKAFSVHPCGKVICEQSVDYYNSTEISDSGDIVLQGDMHTAEDLGLIKADFLGLRTVDIIYDVLDMIGKNYDYIAPHNINFEDATVWDSFRNGHTAGIFQFESEGMKSTLRNIECSSLYDLTVANALYRPGSMAFIDNYAKRRKGIEKYEFLHNDLKPILEDSYAIIVFQEQLIEIGRLAGLSNPDELRQATAKKKPQLMAKIEPELKDGLMQRGWNQEQVDILWDTILDFARYSFNKSHALAYAMIAYICMFLKTYHPKEFICAWINSYGGKTQKLPVCYAESRRLGVPLYDAQFGESKSIAQVYKDGVMIGTQTIKFCNAQIAEELMVLSKNKYRSFIELIGDIKTKTSIESRQLRILTGLNFFSKFGKSQYLLDSIEIYDKFHNAKKEEIKQIKINELEKYGLTEYLMEKFAGKRTAALYKELDVKGLISELCSKLENKVMSIVEQVKFEIEFLEYTTYINPNVNHEYFIVIGFKCYKDVTKPYLILRNISSGEEVKTRVKQGKSFKQNPFGCFSILRIREFSEQFKKRNVGGDWVETDEREPILDEWEVIK